MGFADTPNSLAASSALAAWTTSWECLTREGVSRLWSPLEPLEPCANSGAPAPSRFPAGRQALAERALAEGSPATALRDHKAKRGLYEHHGVREYVLADPEAQFAERFTLGPDGVYGRSDLLGPEDGLRLSSLGGLEISLSEVFERARS